MRNNRTLNLTFQMKQQLGTSFYLQQEGTNITNVNDLRRIPCIARTQVLTYSAVMILMILCFAHQVCATLGSTGSCAFDNLNEVIFISNKYVCISFHFILFCIDNNYNNPTTKKVKQTKLPAVHIIVLKYSQPFIAQKNVHVEQQIDFKRDVLFEFFCLISMNVSSVLLIFILPFVSVEIETHFIHTISRASLFYEANEKDIRIKIHTCVLIFMTSKMRFVHVEKIKKYRFTVFLL